MYPRAHFRKAALSILQCELFDTNQQSSPAHIGDPITNEQNHIKFYFLKSQPSVALISQITRTVKIRNNVFGSLENFSRESTFDLTHSLSSPDSKIAKSGTPYQKWAVISVFFCLLKLGFVRIGWKKFGLKFVFWVNFSWVCRINLFFFEFMACS